jgi:hypothetical protein
MRTVLFAVAASGALLFPRAVAQQPSISQLPNLNRVNASPEPPGRLPPLSPSPAPLPQNAPGAPQPASEKFDTSSLRLIIDDGKWQLWAGNLLLKDFGASEREASDALQVFRDLRVNSHGTIGGVFDYWLTDGEAPSAVMRHKTVVPFDPHTLRVDLLSGQWVLRDAHVVLYNFGRSKDDALNALAVCQRYVFDQLGYVGHPTPSLKYLMKDPTERAPAPPAAPNMMPVSAAMQANELPHLRLVLPGAGDIGDRVPFDGRRLDLRREGGDWVLYAGRAAVGHFGSAERDARMAMETLEQFRVTELCRVGETGFGFFLVNGRPPQGGVIGTGAKPMRTDLLNVRQVAGAWSVCEGSRTLFDFGDKADDARHVLAAIREYHFDHVALVGNGRLGNVYLFVRTRN